MFISKEEKTKMVCEKMLKQDWKGAILKETGYDPGCKAVYTTTVTSLEVKDIGDGVRYLSIEGEDFSSGDLVENLSCEHKEENGFITYVKMSRGCYSIILEKSFV